MHLRIRGPGLRRQDIMFCIGMVDPVLSECYCCGKIIGSRHSHYLGQTCLFLDCEVCVQKEDVLGLTVFYHDVQRKIISYGVTSLSISANMMLPLMRWNGEFVYSVRWRRSIFSNRECICAHSYPATGVSLRRMLPFKVICGNSKRIGDERRLPVYLHLWGLLNM